MRFSIFLPTGFAREFAGFSDPIAVYARLMEIAELADDAGYAALLVPDHLTTVQPSTDMVFEAWTLITALARETTGIRVGQLVTANSYRNPALQAKMASTLDVISGGRLDFGIGAGWLETDHRQYGYEYGTAAGRLRKLEEAIQVILALWTEEHATFEGRYYGIQDAVNEPKGVQRPHIPLMVAGGGEKMTLRLVAQYGDACNIMDSPEVAKHKFDVLRAHCQDVGRDYETIKRTVTTPCIIRDSAAEARALIPAASNFVFPGDLGSYGLVGTLDTVKRRIAAFEEAGVQELILYFEDPTSTRQVADFARSFVV
ncbi:LLM class F420-dependent oxidoreductase [Amycolatopsis oliviviridis]|uniref:LLM class F420-dependent oxidoreductase n=1 Tax=Amycolatopsis oliviviridis TaxID=1471590 RepID=A0ABQ3M6R5_9PSEU|nr:LLM class F420-dependent oxidoreductase [Amycolatopsis oliviviridis]GHH28335.1 LLM class F420-dependent oxidoreductase [Amycolatopsis oliviviridis]